MDQLPGGVGSPKREVRQLVWFETSKKAHLGGVDPLKADRLRTGRVFQQRASFSSAAAL